MKYLTLIPIIGVFVPQILKYDCQEFANNNPLLFAISLVVQIISILLFTALCS
jgi:hypothetical protein